MDAQSSPWTVERVGERWTENFHTARSALSVGWIQADGGFKRLHDAAGAIADKQTKREVRDVDAWQRFTNERARPNGRPSDKMWSLFVRPSRSHLRAERNDAA